MAKKTIKELHNEHNKYPELTQFYLSYKFSKLERTWQFMGYRCLQCGVLFKRENTLPGHTIHCKAKQKYERQKNKEEATNIVTVEGKPWKSVFPTVPIESNQN